MTDIELIYDILYAVAMHAPLRATDYDAGPGFTERQVLDAFDLLHSHGLIFSKPVMGGEPGDVVDHYVTSLTPNGKCIRQVLLQTPLAFFTR